MKFRLISLFVGLILPVAIYAQNVKISLEADGMHSMQFEGRLNGRNLIDKGETFGIVRLTYQKGNDTKNMTNEGIEGLVDDNEISWTLENGLLLKERFETAANTMKWTVSLMNKSDENIVVEDLGINMPILSISEDFSPRLNFNIHPSVNNSASYIYWSPLDGVGNCLLLTPKGSDGFEYATRDGFYYVHSAAVVDRVKDSWPIQSSSATIKAGGSASYSFEFSLVDNQYDIEHALYEKGGVNFRVAPGMVVARGQKASFALRAHDKIDDVSSQYPEWTQVSAFRKSNDGFVVAEVVFSKLGENNLVVDYGNGKKMNLLFFVTEDIETLIKKRSAFIAEHQQHRDASKWYDGLYSLYDMRLGKLLSPDDKGDLPSDYMVGGSDDPSNSKPVYVSEKNVAYPDPAEIASLEYYEKNFVWGKLQRTDKEYPYPYGIYGSENWYWNRSGEYGDYNSGGLGKERMWRTFDYVTHIAIYYNLYLIARDNPDLVRYLDADGYLDRAFHTAMAYFEVPYNIRMGKMWAFHGWCDWAYKQGNFHERYILDVIKALEEQGRQDDADRLRREWEKKVTYMVYENPWPFGSEMFVDRTAFESSYYVGEYALTQKMVPQEQFWYDKNEEKWYSYTEYPLAPKKTFMENQLNSNLTLRGIYEPEYYNCGAAMTGTGNSLEYMTQMGGVTLLDYGVRFADNQADIIRYGYNSLLGSWALMNTGDSESGYGYWYPGADKDGAAGWTFSYYQNNFPYWHSAKVRRGPWQFDGEIDHGFTGGVHGAGCYIVDDPVFGEIAYGGDLEDNGEAWKVMVTDGVRRYISVPQKGRFEMRLQTNGFSADDPVVIAKDLSSISFYLEKRSESPTQRISFRCLPEGYYQILAGKKVIAGFNSSDSEVSFSLKGVKDQITVRRVNS